MEEATLIDLLTLQYIRNKSADSALEYVKLYRQAKDEIKAAYNETDPSFDPASLL